MQNRNHLLSAVLLLITSLLSGCATTGSDGVVEIGPNLYMIGGLGKFTDFSSSGVKARMFQEGNKFCATKGKQIEAVGSTGKDSGYGTYASAEVQFRCI
ncbi:hypothetical protein CSQ90_05235 [Janthinobacterium sp. BJB303]|nr:hypothetical protein CSQ90_05235 [Janthinobacterium sp. BJB303]